MSDSERDEDAGGAPDEADQTREREPDPPWLAREPRAACEACLQPLSGVYFERNGLYCARCTDAAERESASFRGVLAALMSGSLAAVVAIVGWVVIGYVTRREFFIVALAIGVGIGTAVHMSGSPRGGRVYQLLAAALTYAAMAAAPLVFYSLVKRPLDLEWSALVLLALKRPFELAATGDLGDAANLLFIVFGTGFAWVVNEPQGLPQNAYHLERGGRNPPGHFTCHHCGAGVPLRVLTCPGCGTLRNLARVRELSERAGALEAEGDRTAALAEWKDIERIVPTSGRAGAHVRGQIARLEGRTDLYRPADG